MIAFTRALSLLLSITSTLFLKQAVALEQDIKAPIPGYGVEVLKWDFPDILGSQAESLNGTIQAVMAQLDLIKPSWRKDLNITAPSIPIEENQVSNKASNDLFRVVCLFGQFGWIAANQYAILDGIHYLEQLHGRPSLGPGPRTCARVSCSWDSAIWWCNDSVRTLTISGYVFIAQGATAIYKACLGWGVGGQAFSQDALYNVIVRQDHDNC
ncbi:hypothetical protein BT63DRAFT_479529 [Microthyrium microscopicum]|uniref:Uncharacterized protein n=1 Tax=Microthyrium microscopicum TaxID=703497 RepID=A0A6A6UBW9_9PEZI|nr:hypothetical protein BT63DRAFT_479529 [Microthyrium microscopicum]